MVTTCLPQKVSRLPLFALGKNCSKRHLLWSKVITAPFHPPPNLPLLPKLVKVCYFEMCFGLFNLIQPDTLFCNLGDNIIMGATLCNHSLLQAAAEIC